jgi:hypothetical protein
MGTKADMGYHPMLNSEMALEFKDDHQLIEFIEVSAKENKNIELVFKRLIEAIHGFNPGTVEIKFLDSMRESKSEAEKLTQCPHCNSPLRESQIKLKQMGKEVLCHNCLKLI